MKVLRFGMKGPDVELLQAGLQRAGFNNLVIDGVFGQLTRNALRAFQQQNELIVDAIVGPATYAVLYPYLAGYVRYKIVSGDTLFAISQTFKTTLDAIVTANPQIDPYQLRIGQIIIIPLAQDVVFTNISFTTTVLDICLDGLLKRYPFITKEVIGQSVLGRDIIDLKIGKGMKEVSYNASHHANEWITSVILMKFLEDYAKGVSSDAIYFKQRLSELYEQTTIHIVPMVNPDGVDLVTGFFDETTEIYQMTENMNYPMLPFPSGWKANIKGVDLNVNYPALWDRAKEIKFGLGYIYPGPRDYVGPYPLSEPESKAMAVYTLQHDFKLVLAYHTQGEVIYWQFYDFTPPRAEEIVRELENVSGYKAAMTPPESSFGGYKDWFIKTFNLPGYTIEAGYGQNPLPIADFDAIYQRNMGILILAAVLA